LFGSTLFWFHRHEQTHQGSGSFWIRILSSPKGCFFLSGPLTLKQ